MIVALAVLGVATASGVAVSNNGLTSANSGGGKAITVASADKTSALGLTKERSPGARGDAAVNKTKQARASQFSSPTQKRRSRLIPRKADVGLPPAATPLVLPFDMAAVTLPTDQLQRSMAAIGSGNLMPVVLTGSAGAGIGVPGVVALPAISGPGSGSGGNGTAPGGGIGPIGVPAPTVAVSPVPIPEVPEPSVWLTMLIGFGLTGAVLRSKRLRRIEFAAGKPGGA